MINAKYIWLRENIEKYEFLTAEAFSLKETYCKLISSDAMPSDENQFRQVDECYNRFVSFFYNDIICTSCGFADKAVISYNLDCFFVQAGGEYIPIGCYKAQRPAEAAVIIQQYLSGCTQRCNDRSDSDFISMRESINAMNSKFETVKSEKNPSFVKATVMMIISALMICLGVVNMLLLRLPQIVIALLNNTLSYQLDNNPLYSLAGIEVWAVVVFMNIVLVLVFAVVMLKCIDEYRLVTYKEQTGQFLSGAIADVEMCENLCRESIKTTTDNCMTAARRGENVVACNNNLIDKMKLLSDDIENALDFVNREPKKRTRLGDWMLIACSMCAFMIVTISLILILCPLP